MPKYKSLYVNSAEITSKRIQTGEYVPEVDLCLISYTDFLQQCCHKQDNNYVLYHGTNNNDAVISILGEGFLTSVNSKNFNQGTAKLGSGLCTTGDYEHAALYGDNIFTLQVLPNPAMRILWAKNISSGIRSKLELESAAKGCLDVNDLLYKHYNIDIIVDSDIEPQNTIDYEVLIQNSRVFVHPNTGEMLESTFEKCLRSLSGKKIANAQEISHQICAASNVVCIYKKICEPGDVKSIVARKKLRIGIKQAAMGNRLDYSVYLNMLNNVSLRNVLSPREILALMLNSTPTNISIINPQMFNRFYIDVNDLIISGELNAEFASKSINAVSQAIFSYLENVDWGGIRWGEYSFSGWLGSILWLPPTIRQEIIEKLLINFPEKMDDVEFSSSQESLVRIKDLLPNELVIKLQQALDVLNTNPNYSLRPGF